MLPEHAGHKLRYVLASLIEVGQIVTGHIATSAKF
jgi:hypothetical protein